MTFTRNRAGGNGGAIAVYGNRTIWIPDPANTLITFENNTSGGVGGALYFAVPVTSVGLETLPCSLLFKYTGTGVIFSFIDNRATSGDAIYGALFDSKCMTPTGDVLPGTVIRNVSYFSPSFSEDVTLVSSDPEELFFCRNNNINYLYTPSYTVYSGECIVVPAVILGDMQGWVSAPLHASLEGHLPIYTQISSSRRCTNFTYPIFVNTTTNRRPVDLFIRFSSAFTHLKLLSLQILSCPYGFALNITGLFCDCAWTPRKLGTLSCNISERAIHRHGTTWIGVLEYSNFTHIVFSTTCPFTYCNKNDIKISVYPTYFDQDAQCNDNRSGTLCGGCRANYSLALGSNRCLPGCSNKSLSLLVAFAAAGIALVLFIKVLDLTVSQGTVNGLIFYANMVGSQPSLFFPSGGSLTYARLFSFLSVFIAWLNLDLGIETCFFEGMDDYDKAWLQFVFPMYVLNRTLVIIILSHYSIQMSRLLGNNSVPVLATLILLSYSKLLRAVISPLSVTHIEYINGTKI